MITNLMTRARPPYLRPRTKQFTRCFELFCVSFLCEQDFFKKLIDFREVSEETFYLDFSVGVPKIGSSPSLSYVSLP